MIKLLQPHEKRDIELQNHARRQVGLSQIEVKSRKCLNCGKWFESAGDRLCGCQYNEQEDF